MNTISAVLTWLSSIKASTLPTYKLLSAVSFTSSVQCFPLTISSSVLTYFKSNDLWQPRNSYKSLTGLLPALFMIKIRQDNQITGAPHQSLLLSMGLPVLCSPSCTEGGIEERSWGNRSSTQIRAGVLLKMCLQSQRDQVLQNITTSIKKRELLLNSVQGYKRFCSISLIKFRSACLSSVIIGFRGYPFHCCNVQHTLSFSQTRR